MHNESFLIILISMHADVYSISCQLSVSCHVCQRHHGNVYRTAGSMHHHPAPGFGFGFRSDDAVLKK